MIIMKKLTSLLIGCSLALAGAALAQQPVEQQSPSKGKRAPEKTRETQAQPGVNAAKPQEKPAEQTRAMKERGGINERGVTNQHATSHGPGAMKEHGATNAPPKTNVSGEQVGGQPPSARERIEQRRKGMKGQGPAAAAKTSTSPAAPSGAATAAAPS